MTDPVHRLRIALADRYLIERELGRGGMASVYLARDLKHDRPVALKLLHPELAATVGPERFLREIRLTARLEHPHILPVFDSGQASGLLWYTMPYVEGESLRDRLRREGQLPVEEALRLAGEVADALDYARQQGVIHRDIKPENILLARGHARVADFGVARALEGDGSRLTETGLAMGTPAYMSPEQATGGQFDARSDIYSLGCVLYEMLAGEPPYTGPTAQAIIAKRLSDPVPSIRRLRPSVAETVDTALQRSLAHLPADRYGTSLEFAQALRLTGSTPSSTAGIPSPAVAGRRLPMTALVVVLGVLAVLTVLFAWQRSHPAGSGRASSTVLAVLPFENLGDSSDRYFADGVTDEVRTKLAQLDGIEVIARGSSNQYRGSTKPPQQIALELGAGYLLTATVRWQKAPAGPSRVRVISELVEIHQGAVPRTRWQQPFDAALDDVFQVQADIAGKVAGALDLALADSTRRRLTERPTRNLAAYDAFLRGDQLIITEGKTDFASARRAADAYANAVRLDSTFALAWARLTRAELLRYGNSDNRDSVAQAARRAADRALALAPERPGSYYAIGMVRNLVDLDAEGAIAAWDHARTLGPADADVLSILGGVLAAVGRTEEAAARFAEAARLDPRSLLLARRYAGILLFLKRPVEADSVATAGLRLAPDHFELVGTLVSSRLLQGDSAGARTALRDALRHMDPQRLIRNTDPGVLWVDDSLEALALRLPPSAFAEDRAEGLVQRATVQWGAGQYAEARAGLDSARPLLEDQRIRQPADPRVPHLLMFAYASTGRRADALAEAERWHALVRPKPNTPAWSLWYGLRVGIELLSGNAHGAVALLDSTLALPGGATRAWLRIDPGFATLRGNPRFQRLVAGE